MKKPTLLLSFSLAVAMLFGSSAMALDYQNIRMLQTDKQFQTAVDADTVVVSLPKNLLLLKNGDSGVATKRIENVLAMRGANGQIEKELVVRCELRTSTQKRNLVLPHTSGTAHPWRVTEIQRINVASEKWVLHRDNMRLEMGCASFEREGEDLFEVPLTPSLVNRALSTVSGSVLTEVQPAEMVLNGYPHNDVVTSSAPISAEVSQ